MNEEFLEKQFNQMENIIEQLRKENNRLKKENHALKKYFILLWGYVE